MVIPFRDIPLFGHTHLVMVIPFRDIPLFGHTLQGYLVMVIPFRDILLWSYPSGISRDGHTLQEEKEHWVLFLKILDLGSVNTG